jgi:ketosteroid isomerase-like protein
MAASEKDNLKVLKDVYDGFNRGDLERMRSSMTTGTTMYVAAMNQTLKGPNAIVDYFRVYRQAFEATVNVTRQTACNDLVLSEFVGRGTHKGVFQTPMGDIPPTGRKIDVPVCHILQFKDGKIVDIHEYFDVATLMTQLGISNLAEERQNY